MCAVRQLCYLVTLVLVLVLNGCGFPANTPSATVPASTVHETTSPATVTPTALPGRPRNAKASPSRLLIPAINLNAAVEEVGILSDGNFAGDMATPSRNPWEHVGWYDAGPRPGERGSAVIDGHL